MRLVLALLTALVAGAAGGAESITVFAAASLTNAVQEIARAWQAEGGTPVATSFAAASTLAKQIENGAPADVFISADLRWMDYLQERQQIDAASRITLLGNRLVLIVPAGRSLAVEFTPGFPIAQAFSGRLAVGDPSNVPVGLYAKEAFTALGWWEQLQPRLAPTADVRAALRLVETGEVEAGVVYATDAAASAKVAVAALVPESLHKPVRYPAALTASANPAARGFLAYLRSPAATAVFTRLGFSVRADG